MRDAAAGHAPRPRPAGAGVPGQGPGRADAERAGRGARAELDAGSGFRGVLRAPAARGSRPVAAARGLSWLGLAGRRCLGRPVGGGLDADASGDARDPSPAGDAHRDRAAGLGVRSGSARPPSASTARLLALSPDGTLARVRRVNRAASPGSIAARSIASTSPSRSPARKGALHAFFSPDGRHPGLSDRRQGQAGLARGRRPADAVRCAVARRKAVGPANRHDLSSPRRRARRCGRIAANGGGRPRRSSPRSSLVIVRINFGDALPDGKAVLMSEQVRSVSGDYDAISLPSTSETRQSKVLVQSGYDPRYVSARPSPLRARRQLDGRRFRCGSPARYGASRRRCCKASPWTRSSATHRSRSRRPARSRTCRGATARSGAWRESIARGAWKCSPRRPERYGAARPLAGRDEAGGARRRRERLRLDLGPQAQRGPPHHGSVPGRLADLEPHG